MYLVFEGGATKGIAYIGVMRELERIGVLSQIQGCAGTSIGALFATLVVLGFEAEEVENFFWENSPYDIINTCCKCCGIFDYIKLYFNKGEVKINRLKKWLRTLL
jgi:predicted acylesterase/phospholipase RssA